MNLPHHSPCPHVPVLTGDLPRSAHTHTSLVRLPGYDEPKHLPKSHPLTLDTPRNRNRNTAASLSNREATKSSCKADFNFLHFTFDLKILSNPFWIYVDKNGCSCIFRQGNESPHLNHTAFCFPLLLHLDGPLLPGPGSYEGAHHGSITPPKFMVEKKRPRRNQGRCYGCCPLPLPLFRAVYESDTHPSPW